MIKLNLEKLKKIYLMIDNAFAWIKETAIGKFVIEKILFRSKSFYSVFYTLILILISQLSTLKYAEELASKIEEQINTSEGFINFMWHVANFFAPSGNGYIIFILLLVIPIILWLRNKELNYRDTVKNLNILSPASKNKTKSLSALRYQSEIVGFIGRETELSNLEKYNDSGNLVQWWIIGGTGGSGKSRLALELCNMYKAKSWHCGFINFNSNLHYDEWEPEKHHLIVCDYVLNKEKDIVNLIHNAIRLEVDGKLYFKIRILLIERDANTVINILNNTNTFGSMIESYLFSPNSLSLTNFKDEDLRKMLQKLAEYFDFPVEKLPELYTFVNQYESQAFLMGGLYCLYHYNQTIADTPNDFKEIVRKLIQREREHWIIGNNQEKYLVLATLINGINPNKQVLSAEVNDFLSDYSPVDYEKIVGEASDSYIAPLSHDLISELYVLDELKPQSAFNNKKYLKFIDLALGIDEGKELISFFARSSQDFPEHKTLESLKNPYKESGKEFLLWALTISNIVDVINLTLEEKLDIYQKVSFGLTSFVPESHLIDKALFLRLLNHFSENKKAQMYLGYIKINEPILAQAGKSEKQVEEFVDTLLPLQYCKDIISLYIGLDDKYKNTMLGSHIVEIYHHLLMHLSVDRSIDYSKVIDIYDEISRFIEDKGQDNYMITIINYHKLCANLIASIWQFNHLQNDAEFRLEFALKIKNRALKSSRMKYNDNDTVVQASYLAQIYPPLSIYYANNKDRNYLELIELIKEYKKRIVMGNQIDDESFVSCCVQLAHNFQSKQNYNYFLTLYDECKLLAEKYKTQEIVISFSLMVHQMLKNNSVAPYTEYIKQPHDDMFMNEAINLAVNYPTVEYGILTKGINEVSSRYSKCIESKDYQKALSYMAMAIKIISNTENIEYIESKKIWAGGFIIAGLMDYINNNYPLDNTKKILDSIKKAKFFTIEQALSQTTSDIFSMGMRAKNAVDPNFVKRCIECLNLIQPYLSDRQADSINQCIEPLLIAY